MKPPELWACVLQTHDCLLGDMYTNGLQTTLFNLGKNLQEINNLSDKSETKNLNLGSTEGWTIEFQQN